MTLYFISIVPIVIYLIVLKLLDSFSLIKWKYIIISVLYGALSCFALFMLTRIPFIKEYYEMSGVAAAAEEILKGLLLVWLVSRKKIVFFSDAVIYGAAIGAGFALLENVLYVSANSAYLLANNETAIGSSIYRGFGTALMHMGCTALVVAQLIIFTREMKENRGKNPTQYYMISFIPSIFIHWIHNLFLLSAPLQLIAIILLFMLLFTYICRRDETLIHNWLDESINNDVSLLGAMKKGEFFTTNAGKYLLTIKSMFKPEDFFDICCYVSLYTELLIAAKSTLIMKEAGMQDESDAKTKEANKAKVTELKTLKKSIGPTAVLALRPIVDTKDIDKWILDSLI